ncbi:hypothetical protein QYE76_056481 [Lolium multiflorum]|uniref:Uncharacterized protein n=1 Tax=Lolium multiflorum TaxID=4521 RepID=A0AAD8T1P6_LOLMU|nr:hypothetical protein QYE76_056481 [Lolium multiflorum]
MERPTSPPSSFSFSLDELALPPRSASPSCSVGRTHVAMAWRRTANQLEKQQNRQQQKLLHGTAAVRKAISELEETNWHERIEFKTSLIDYCFSRNLYFSRIDKAFGQRLG